MKLYIYIFLFASVILTTMAVCRKREMNAVKNGYINREPLPDLILDKLPNFQDPNGNFALFNDVLCITPLIVLIIITIVKKDTTDIKIFLYIASILFRIRLMSLILTPMPKSSRKCVVDNSPLSHHNCMDTNISGHTIICLLPILIMMKSNLISMTFTVILFTVYILQEIIKLAFKHHYSTDILYAVLLSYLSVSYTFSR